MHTPRRLQKHWNGRSNSLVCRSISSIKADATSSSTSERGICWPAASQKQKRLRAIWPCWNRTFFFFLAELEKELKSLFWNVILKVYCLKNLATFFSNFSWIKTKKCNGNKISQISKRVKFVDLYIDFENSNPLQGVGMLVIVWRTWRMMKTCTLERRWSAAHLRAFWLLLLAVTATATSCGLASLLSFPWRPLLISKP